MKIYHFSLLFLIFLLAAILRTDMSVGKLKTVEREKKELERSLNSATSDAINYLAASGSYGTNSINKDDLASTFFNSMYSSLGILSDRNAQAEIEMYLPVMLLCDSDGYYIYYYDDYETPDGHSYTKRIWSEKIPYYYQDAYFTYQFTLTDKLSIYDRQGLLAAPKSVLELNYHELQTDPRYLNFRTQHSDSFLLQDVEFEQVKKIAIINQLEEAMAYYTSKHNTIAKQNGITYTFSFPFGHETEWASYIDDINIMVVFQGYPYGKDMDYTFNKVASAGANILRKPIYKIEQKSWYYLAHVEGCEKLTESTSILEETFDSVEACAYMGAYCDDCIKYGARVPEIK